MVDTTALQLALRTRLATLVVATTGSVALSATASGYARAAGSFIDDGMAVGMEIAPAGFASNPTDVITAITAGTVTTASARSAEAAAAARSLTSGLPVLRGGDNARFEPVPGRPYIEAELVPATTTQRTAPASNSHIEETGLYVVRWYGLANKGSTAIRRSVDAIKRLFAPGTAFVIGGDAVRVRGNPGPQAGQILPQDGGFAVCTVTIGWIANSRNAIAA